MFVLVLEVQRCTYLWKPTTFVHLWIQICIFQEMKKWNIFFRIFQLQGSKNGENQKVIEKLNISLNSPPILSTRICYYLPFKLFGRKNIDDVGGVDPPTNRPSVNSVTLKVKYSMIPELVSGRGDWQVVFSPFMLATQKIFGVPKTCFRKPESCSFEWAYPL